MTLEEYFAKPDTPAPHSPIAELMRQLVERRGIGFEDARSRANEMIQKAAGARNFTFPRVLTADQEAAKDARLSGLLALRQRAKPKNGV